MRLLGTTVIVLLVIFIPLVIYIIIGIRMKKLPNAVGTESLIGRAGYVKTLPDFRGEFRIEIRGESWRAKSESGRKYSEGDSAVIRSLVESELLLIVE